MVLTASPILKPWTPGPIAATVPAASYPSRAGSFGSSRYWPLRNMALGAVESQCVDADLNLTLPGWRDLDLLDLEDFGSTDLMKAWFKSWVFQVTVRTVPVPRRWRFFLSSD